MYLDPVNEGIVDGDEADALLRENHLGVVAYLQVVPPEPAQVLYN